MTSIEVTRIRGFTLMLVGIELAYCSKELEDDQLLYHHVVDLLTQYRLVPPEQDVQIMQLIFKDLFRLLRDQRSFAVFTRGPEYKRPARELSVLWVTHYKELFGYETRNEFFDHLMGRTIWMHRSFAWQQLERSNPLWISKGQRTSTDSG